MSLFNILLILFLTTSCISKLTKKNLFVDVVRPDLVNLNFTIENSKKGLLVNFSYDVKTDLDFMWVRFVRRRDTARIFYTKYVDFIFVHNHKS
jgi:hypothetical protein